MTNDMTLSERWNWLGDNVLLVGITTVIILTLAIMLITVIRAAAGSRTGGKSAAALMRQRDQAVKEYDRERKKLADMPNSAWTKHTTDDINHQRALTDAKREKVRMLEDELGRIKAKG